MYRPAASFRRICQPVEVPMLDTARSNRFISIEDVSKTFSTRKGNVRALSQIDLGINAGEFVSIVGPSGCGKSTLLMILAGLMTSTSGKIHVNGKAVTEARSDLGIVFQRDVLLDWRTALDNITLQAQIRDMDMAAATERAKHLMEMVGLKGFENAYPQELSGGMRQRVSICRALLHEPPLLVMDEPFGALDALTRDQLQLDLLRIWQRSGMTVVFITHSISEAVFLSDRVVVMSPRPGKIEKVIDIELARPRRLSVRETPQFAAHSHEVTDIFKTLGVLREGDDE
jgi:NitT/TauT family transport system ATP-binding protein